MTRERRGLIVLAGIAIAMPAVLIGARIAGPPAFEAPPPEPVDWRVPPPMSAALARPLFGVAEAEAPPPADAPDLVGIVGRLGADAVAMVRGQDGAVRTLKPGEGVDGWQLRSLAIDAAYFTRGTQSARVPMGAD